MKRKRTILAGILSVSMLLSMSVGVSASNELGNQPDEELSVEETLANEVQEETLANETLDDEEELTEAGDKLTEDGEETEGEADKDGEISPGRNMAAKIKSLNEDMPEAENDLGQSEIIAEGSCGEQVTWTLDNSGVLTLSGTGDTEDYESWLEVPWYRQKVSKAVISPGVTSIGDYLFDGTVIREITIPDSVTRIGESAFDNCYLETVELPDGIQELGVSCFQSCSRLETVRLPEGLTKIPDSMFKGCKKLNSMTIPSGVKVIGRNAFYRCESLTEIAIPDAVAEIGEWAFAGCKNLMVIQASGDNPVYSSVDGVLFNKDQTRLCIYPAGREGDYEIPEGVVALEDNAFSGCTKIETLIFPSTLEELVGGGNKWPVDQVKSIQVSADNPWYSSMDGVLYNKEQTILLVCPDKRKGDFVVPSGVKEIGIDAFDGCHELTGITLPNGLKKIERGAFEFCISLKEINIPASVERIRSAAFAYCNGVKKIVFYGKNPLPNDLSELDVFLDVEADAYYCKDIWGEEMNQNYQAATLTFHDCIPVPSEISQVESAGYHAAEVSWQPVKNAEGYRLYYQEGGSGPWKYAAQLPGSETSYVHTGLQSGKSYTYYLRAYHSLDDGEKLFGAYSPGVSVTPVASPSKITQVASWGYNAVKVSWEAVENADGYRLYYQEEGSGPWKYAAQLSGSETSYVHTGRVTGKEYIYYVRAYRTFGSEKAFGAYSAGKSGKALPRQAKIKEASAGKDQAAIHWERVNGSSGYRIYYKNSENGKWHYVTQIGEGSATSYVHKGVKTGEDYYYTMRAYRTVNGEKVFGAYASWKKTQ